MSIQMSTCSVCKQSWPVNNGSIVHHGMGNGCEGGGKPPLGEAPVLDQEKAEPAEPVKGSQLLLSLDQTPKAAIEVVSKRPNPQKFPKALRDKAHEAAQSVLAALITSSTSSLYPMNEAVTRTLESYKEVAIKLGIELSLQVDEYFDTND